MNKHFWHHMTVTFWFLSAAILVELFLMLAVAGGAAGNAIPQAAATLSFALLSGLIVDGIRFVNARIDPPQRQRELPSLKRVFKKELGVKLRMPSFLLRRRSGHVHS